MFKEHKYKNKYISIDNIILCNFYVFVGAQRLAKASKNRNLGANLQNDVEKMESDKTPNIK